MPRHVIVGGGPAAMNALEALRALDADASITLISDEPPYSRMALPYFLAGNIPEPQLSTASDDYFDRLRVERHVGRRATGIDTNGRAAVLDDGSRIDYDTLLLATGSSPVRPPIPGADTKHVHNLWTLADSKAVLASARGKRPRVVLVGAGFIGLIILNALHKLGWRIAVVEVEGHILPRMLDRRGAEAGEAWLRQRGVDVYTGCGVREIGGSRKKTVVLANGQQLEANVVILSTGIRPNVGFLDGSGIRVDRGILVDEHLRTSVPNVYAAGDAAQGPNLLGGPAEIHAIQTTATDHGRVAAANMAGRSRRYPGSLIMNILDLGGLHCASFGRWQDDGDTTVVWSPARPVYRKLVWDGTRLAGGIIVGPIEDTTMLTDVGMLKGLIQARVDLGEWKHYLKDRPWDLRRAYVASGTATRLLPETILGAAATPRLFHFQNLGPRTDAGPHHAALLDTRPADFDTLRRTPTPGIHKSKPGGPPSAGGGTG
jgi:NAD(P)H-nitrite reductase large subunit